MSVTNALIKGVTKSSPSTLSKLIGNEANAIGGSMLDKLAVGNGKKIAVKLAKGTADDVPVYSKANPMGLQDAYERTVSLRNANGRNIRNDIGNVIDNFGTITPEKNPYASGLMSKYDDAIEREIGTDSASELRDLVSNYTKFGTEKEYDMAKSALKKYLGSPRSDNVVSKSVDMLDGAGVYRANNSPNGISWSTSPSVANESRIGGAEILQGEITPDSRVIAPQFTERYQPQIAQREVIGTPSNIAEVSAYDLKDMLAGEGMRISDELANSASKYLRKTGGNFGHKGVKGQRGGSAPRAQQSVDDGSITLYHGTPNKFDDFDESLPSVWFSDSDKNLRDTGLSIGGGQTMNIMERQLPQSLKIADEDLADRLTKQQLQDRGYAGISYTERGPNGDETYYEIFSPNKTLRKTPEIRQSLELSPEQMELFKDSVIRDNSGMLKKMYHGSPNGEIKEFRPGSYFTEDKEYADGYQNPEASSLTPGAKKIKNTPKTYEVYLDIKKPFTLSDAKAKDIYFNEYIKGGNSAYYDPYGTTRKMIDELEEVDWVDGENLMEWIQKNHPEYDGMYLDEGGAGGYSPDNEYVDRGKSIVNFRGDQVKILN